MIEIFAARHDETQESTPEMRMFPVGENFRMSDCAQKCCTANYSLSAAYFASAIFAAADHTAGWGLGSFMAMRVAASGGVGGTAHGV